MQNLFRPVEMQQAPTGAKNKAQRKAQRNREKPRLS